MMFICRSNITVEPPRNGDAIVARETKTMLEMDAMLCEAQAVFRRLDGVIERDYAIRGDYC